MSLVQQPRNTSTCFVAHDPTTTQRKRNGTQRRDDKLVTIVGERFVRSDHHAVRYDAAGSLGRPAAVFLYRRRSFFTGLRSRLPPSVVDTRFIHVPTVRYPVATPHRETYASSPHRIFAISSTRFFSSPEALSLLTRCSRRRQTSSLPCRHLANWTKQARRL